MLLSKFTKQAWTSAVEIAMQEINYAKQIYTESSSGDGRHYIRFLPGVMQNCDKSQAGQGSNRCTAAAYR